MHEHDFSIINWFGKHVDKSWNLAIPKGKRLADKAQLKDYESIRLCRHNRKSLERLLANHTHWAAIELHDYRSNKLPSLAHLEQLEFLSVIDSPMLYSLPEETGAFAALKYLFLSNVCFDSLPFTLGELDKLEYLDLDILCELSELPDCFSRFPHLRHVSFRICGFSRLPDSFGQLAALEEFTIEECPNLIDFPDFSGLKKLRILKIKDNPSLLRFPESITQLTELEELIIDLPIPSEAVFHLPPEIKCLKKLKKLVISGARQVTLSEETGELTSLEHLELISAQMTRLPAGIGNCQSLNYLCLRGYGT